MSCALAGRPLVLQDAVALRLALRPIQTGLSERCAANLVLFRSAHGYRLTEDAVIGETYDGQKHVMPLVGIRSASDSQLARWFDLAPALYPLDETEIGRFGVGYTISANADDADYIYDCARMATMVGPIARKKRAQADRFQQQSRPFTRSLEGDAVPDALAVLDQWQSDVAKPWSATDYAACREGLLNIETLGLEGRITYTGEGAAAGFVLGGAVAPDTFAVHFAKGGRRHRDIFPYMFRELAQRFEQRFARLNFEQDLGSVGFRHAKRALAPSGQLSKYRVTRQA